MAGRDLFLSVDGKERALRAGWSKYGKPCSKNILAP
jgi:hypothetical protein